MSGQAASFGTLIAGALIGIGALAVPGGFAAFGWLSVALIASGALGLLGPKPVGIDQAAAQDLAIQGSDYGPPVPVLFGRGRLVGNILRFDNSQFESQAIFSKRQGGKGGKKKRQVVGFDYFGIWHIGFCMGEVDAVVNFYGQPGESNLVNENPNYVDDQTIGQSGTTLTASADLFTEVDIGATVFFSTDETAVIASINSPTVAVADASATVTATAARLGKEIYFEFGDTETFTLTGASDGGDVVLKSGSETQTQDPDDPYVSDVLNYRGVCWGLFGKNDAKFKMGREPRPRTYVGDFVRFPAHDSSFEMVRPDTTTITGFKVRGSNDQSKQTFLSANPAAVIYECFTNTDWGRAFPQDAFNEASFIAASLYFVNNNIGMDIVADQETDIESFINDVMKHLRMVLVEDGAVLKLRVLTDIPTIYTEIQTLRLSQIKDFDLSIPTWPAQANEVVAEFNDMRRNGKSNVIVEQNLGAIGQIGGRLNTQRISLRGFAHFEVARPVALRVLAEVSYPLRPVSFKVNRHGWKMEPGDVVRIISDKTGATFTLYVQVTSVDHASAFDDWIQIEAVEDMMFPPVAGEELSITAAAVWPWDSTGAIQHSAAFEDVVETVPDVPIDPITCVEVPAILGDGKTIYAIFAGQQVSSFFTSMNVFAQVGDGAGPNFNEVGNVEFFTISGELLTAYNERQHLDRSGSFDFSLTDQTKDGSEVLTANLIEDEVDDFETLIAADQFWMIIGEELLQIGKIELVTGNQYTASNIIRARYGTHPDHHPIGRKVFFSVESFGALDVSTIQQRRVEVAFKAFPVSLETEGTQAIIVQPFHVGPDNTKLLGESALPLHPLLVSYESSTVSGVFKLTVRPRFIEGGAESEPFFHIMESQTSTLGGQSYAFQYYSDDTQVGGQREPESLNVLSTSTAGGTLFGANENEFTIGEVVLTLAAPPVGANNIRIWSVQSGRRSRRPLIISTS